MSLLLATFLAASLTLAAGPTYAATTFTVNLTGDQPDFSGSDGRCDTDSTAFNGLQCTLRAALQQANATAGADTINFNIPGIGVKTISPASDLPKITDTVTVNGYSQPGSTTNTLSQGTNAVLRVELAGTLAGPNASGLTTDRTASNVVVRGLAINRFGFTGVELLGNNSKVEGNFIGTDPSGILDRGNGSFGGVLVHGDSNAIGGNSPFQRNLVSGNGEGVDLNTNADNNRVQGNLIGTGKDGTSDLGNDEVGVALVDAGRNLVGGTGPGEANTIAFNGGHGVRIVSFSSDNVARGNRVLANSVFSNGLLGIDLRGGTENAAGATANDQKDPDQGPTTCKTSPS